MIPKRDLNERAAEWELREDVVEKDYVIGWLLWGIGTQPELSSRCAFKGGTCLKKCFIETYRFSEDLDFTLLPGATVDPDEIRSVLLEVGHRVYQASGIDTIGREPSVRARPNRRSFQGQIYYRGPRGAPSHASVKLDLTIDEDVVQPTVRRPISHPYPDQLPGDAMVRCYGFEEVFAEKLRAMGQRCRPRDLYDIINLFRRRDLSSHPDLVRDVYYEKCSPKGLPVFGFDDIETSPFREEIEVEWSSMLAHQLPSLPPFENFWKDLPRLYDWLEGRLEVPELEAIRGGFKADFDDEWRPPHTAWAWGEGIPLESVRFAGANQLCINLTYGGESRLIEPHSLRRTNAGHLLLYGWNTRKGQIRAYRVDRIQAINVTATPFTPRFAVEFTPSGDLIARATARRVRSVLPERRYLVECLRCGQQLRRSTKGTKLRPHKEPEGSGICHGQRGTLISD